MSVTLRCLFTAYQVENPVNLSSDLEINISIYKELKEYIAIVNQENTIEPNRQQESIRRRLQNVPGNNQLQNSLKGV